MNVQRALASEQIAAFRHADFVDDQLRDFTAICPVRSGAVVDVGGGCGYFARALGDKFPAISPVVLDRDSASLAACEAQGVAAEMADALWYVPAPDQQAACFNLILHHLVGPDEPRTRRLQRTALGNWCRAGTTVFVNEYVYDSWLGDVGAALIYAVTSSLFLSRFVRANTAGVGVRFRGRRGWEEVFRRAGFDVVASTRGEQEKVRWPLRLLIRSIRRDSFVLRPH